MSNKACCVKIKNCGRLMQGHSESQMFLIESMGVNPLPEALEKEIVSFYDDSIARMEKIEKALFEASRRKDE